MAANSNFNRVLRGAILRQLRADNTYDAFVNRELVRGSFEEPEDTVNVQTLGDVVLSNYSGSLPTPQDIDTNETSISASHKKAFAFKAPVDDSASAVADLFREEGVASLLQAAQEFILGKYTGASLQVTYDPANDSIRDKVAEAATKLDNAEAPMGPGQRWMVLPPKVMNDIDDDVIEESPTGLADELLRNRFVGEFKGFRLYKAPNGQFTNTGSAPSYDHALAGINQSIAYEDAVLNVRRVPSTDFSGDQIDGLHVAGAQVIRDGATVDFRIKQ
jgi:hypothetical protein